MKLNAGANYSSQDQIEETKSRYNWNNLIEPHNFSIHHANKKLYIHINKNKCLAKQAVKTLATFGFD